MWQLDTLQYDAITVCFPSRDTTQPNSLISLKPNSIRHLIMLRKYIHHLVQDSHLSMSSDATDHALEPDNFLHTTFHQFMSWKLNEITTSSPSPPPSVTASDPRAAPSTISCSTQLLHFKTVTEFRQPLQVQSHLEMPRILVQLGHIQRT